MTFEEMLAAALTTKFPGVDAKIIGRVARKLGKTATGTTEAEAQTVADGVTFQQVLESYGDARATEASNTARQNAVADYEKKHGIRDGKPVQTATPETTSTPVGQSEQPDDVPAWAKALLESNKAMQAELQAYKAEKTASTRLSQFRQAISKAPDKVRQRYEKDFTRLTFKDDDDFAGYLREIEPDIAAIASQAQIRGAQVGSPLSGQTAGQGADALVKARFEAAAKADTVPAIAGLPNTNR